MRIKDYIKSANTGLDAIKRAPIVDYETNIRCIRIQDISQSKSFAEWGFTQPSIKDYKKFKLKKNDILIARTGATVGVSYIVLDDCDAVFNNGTIRLKLNNNIDAKFVFYVFQSKEFKQYIDNVSCVATQPNLKVENLLRYTLPELPLSQQQKISNYLTTFDALIEINNKRIKLLEQMAENLYKNFFTYHKIHNCAKEIKLSKIINIVRGVSYLSEEIDVSTGNNLINLKNIQGFGGYRRDGLKLYSGKFKQEQTVKYGDLVMGVTDMTQDRRTVGAVALIPKLNGTSVISADLIKIDSSIDNCFLYSMFRYGSISKHISQFANGANVLHLKPQAILDTKIILPEQPLIDKFTFMVKPIFSQIECLSISNQNLIKQRDMLLPRLMSGKLQVK